VPPRLPQLVTRSHRPTPVEVIRLERATDQRRRAIFLSMRGEQVVSTRLRRHLAEMAAIQRHRESGRLDLPRPATVRTEPLCDSCA
jgi:hypothetical protein